MALRTGGENEAVAAYATVTGAERAVAHLVSLGYDEHDVGIAPRGFEVVDQHPLRRLLARWLRVGIVVGVVSTSLISFGREIGTDALMDSVLPLIAWGAALGVAGGLAIGLVAYVRWRNRASPGPPDAIAPTRYDVVVDQDQERARHGLARWWDPAAPPADWQQPA